MTPGRAILVAALIISGPLAAEAPLCAVHSASRQETIALFSPLAGLMPSEITERDPEAWKPRFRDGLFATDRVHVETRITSLRIIGSDWTMAHGLQIGTTRAAFLDRYGAATGEADGAVVRFEKNARESDFGAEGCLINVTFDDDDCISELAMGWQEMRMHPDPDPEAD